ncbi:DUF1697 domain-containing protein [Nocardioides sp. CPCC 205120]|uniref:DUF1697 domain-containing protein n=1 Tax=Nocardioides sp. CPCC 205120 TaxID=3406462 RepID=UPI003B50EF8F
MPTYVAFLRAINLGPRRRYPMVELRAALEAAGFADPTTYIHTGNVLLRTPMRSIERLTERLEEALSAERGFPIEVAVLTPAEVRTAAAEGEAMLAAATAEAATGGAEPPAGQYVTLLRDTPAPEAAAAFEALSGPDARVRVSGRAMHLTLTGGYVATRLDNARAERVLGVRGTSRNLTVVRRVAADWC